MHGKHVTIVDVGRVVRIQNLIRYEANTGFSNAEKPVLKPNRKPVHPVFSIPVHNPSVVCSEKNMTVVWFD